MGLFTVWPVVVPLSLAAILAYLSDRLFRRVLRRLPNRTGAALAMTMIMTTAVLAPLAWMALVLKSEAVAAIQAIPNLAQSLRGWQPPAWLTELPFIGERIAAAVALLLQDPKVLERPALAWVQGWVGELPGVAGMIGQAVLLTGVLIMALFFAYRDGESWMRELRVAVTRLFGASADPFLATAAMTLRAVVFGLFGTALAQGVIAGMGYYVAGVPAPLLFTVVTAVFALFPFGTTVVWGPLALWMFLQGQSWAALGLIIWGLLAVGTVDNVLRPWLISSAAPLNFFAVTVGVIGGTAMFGVAGLLIGPLTLALLGALWDAWLGQKRSNSETAAVLSRPVTLR